MTLESILVDIQAENEEGITVKYYYSDSVFNKNLVDALKGYGFEVVLFAKKNRNRRVMKVCWRYKDKED